MFSSGGSGRAVSDYALWARLAVFNIDSLTRQTENSVAIRTASRLLVASSSLALFAPPPRVLVLLCTYSAYVLVCSVYTTLRTVFIVRAVLPFHLARCILGHCDRVARVCRWFEFYAVLLTTASLVASSVSNVQCVVLVSGQCILLRVQYEVYASSRMRRCAGIFV